MRTMERRDIILLVLIVVLAAMAVYVDLNIEHPEWVANLEFWRPAGGRDIAIRYGLDVRGGLRVLLAADIAPDAELEATAMDTARQIIENRVNAMGLTEPVVQQQGERRIIVELPGIEDPEQAIQAIQGTALLEFIDAGNRPLLEGTVVWTTQGGPTIPQATPTVTATAQPAEIGPMTATLPLSSEVTTTQELTPVVTGTVYETILTGADLEDVGLSRSETNEYRIPFQLTSEAAQTFYRYTSSHIGQYLCIVLDKQVISCPTIRDAIPNGQGVITLGNADYESARNLAVQLRYGRLPVPLRVETVSTVGPTLGEIAVNRSVRAGIIGLSLVLLFMLVYYRFPGLLADLALVLYALLNLALYKLAPVTLTLPGIAGFLLSAGMAVDANILVFERMKEELRGGRSLRAAAEAGFSRAWTSIRDSQISILISCAVLYFFGTSFGASMVRGFAVTLAIGTVVNIFTAVVATRTFVRLAFHLAGDWLRSRRWLLGV